MNLDSFFDLVRSTLESEKFKECPFPLYRGHSKSDYELLPTLHRACSKTGKDTWTLENNLYCDFRSLAGPHIKFANSWEIVFAMRHEGVPTRLLDWTENLGTALFFAFDSEIIQSPHIWILEPYNLNKKNPKLGEILVNPEEDLGDYQSSYASKCNDNKIEIHDLPILVYPNRTNYRIFAQRGLFTIHGLDENKMELTCSDCLEKIDIPEEVIGKLKDMLKLFGINKYSVYPDLMGLREHLKNSYGY
jgi:hypothetical protein